MLTFCSAVLGVKTAFYLGAKIYVSYGTLNDQVKNPPKGVAVCNMAFSATSSIKVL